MSPVYITGIGSITAIGNNVDQILNSLINSRHGVGTIRKVVTTLNKIFPVAEIDLSNDELCELLNLKKNNNTRTTLLGMLAAREAVANSGIDVKSMKTAVISATSVGGMDKSEKFYDEFFTDKVKGRLRDVVFHDCGDSTAKIAAFIGADGYLATISTACSSSANSLMYGARLIRHGFADCVVAGGVDSLTRFTINGFNTLMILDKQHCRPFDDSRTGLNLGEGAGFVVLESERSVKLRNAKVLCTLSGFSNANDAYHQTASSPEGIGATMAMKNALQMSGLDPVQIDYINVHGTGTQNNDLSEGSAIRNIFGEKIPPFSSTKPFTGHTLGAAGGIEAVLSVLSIQNGLIYPNLNFQTPMKELQLVPNTKLIVNKEINNVLSNSFGFGGNNSTLIFSKV